MEIIELVRCSLALSIGKELIEGGCIATNHLTTLGNGVGFTIDKGTMTRTDWISGWYETMGCDGVAG